MIENSQKCNCPDFLPKKFWDDEKGEARLEDMSKSYREMERMMSGVQHRRAPNHPDEYCIECKSDLFSNDPVLNTRLHEAGFSQEQAQLVYDLAHEALEPLVAEIFAMMHNQYQVDRLCDKFGGEERWMETARQLKAWGGQKFGPTALNAMCGSYDGVITLYEMMTRGEPGMGRFEDTGGLGNEEDIRKLMRTPKYWRERDPATVERVREGFRRLYPG